MGNFQATNTISGREGSIWVSNDNMAPTEVAYAQSIEATVEVNTTDVNILGLRATQQKPSGYSGSGTLTLYYTTSLFREAMLDYMHNGTLVHWTIQVENNDPASGAGNQVIELQDVIFTSVPMGIVNAEEDVLTEDLDFTFGDAVLVTPFSAF